LQNAPYKGGFIHISHPFASDFSKFLLPGRKWLELLHGVNSFYAKINNQYPLWGWLADIKRVILGIKLSIMVLKATLQKVLQRTIAFITLLSVSAGYAQIPFIDNFDSYTTGNPAPAWTTVTVNPAMGTPPFFTTPLLSGSNRVLRANGPTGGTGTRRIYIQTPLNITNLNAQPLEWRFDFWYNGVVWNATNVNADNHGRVFLVSNTADIDGALNGYHLRLLDNIQLWRSSTSTSNNLNISGGTLTDLSTLPQPIRVQVIRLVGGRWLVFVNDVYQGSANDDTHTATQFFGFHHRYSAAGRNAMFQVDNLTIQSYANTIPTMVSAVNGSNTRQIRVRFNELMDINALRQSAVFSIGGVTATQVLPAEDEFSVYVNFPFDFAAGGSYMLQSQNLTDIYGNVSATIPDFAFTFNDLLAPKVLQATVVAPQSLDVLFDEPVEQVSATTLANYTWSGNPPRAAVRDAANPALVHLLFNTNFPENSNQTLIINGVRDLLGNAMSSASIVFQRDTRAPTVNDLTGWRFLSATQIEITFSEPVELITAQLVNNYSLSNGIGFPLRADRNPLITNIVVITFAQPVPTNTPLTLRVAGVRDLAGNVMSTNNITVRYDPDAPEWQQLLQRSSTVLELRFSEALSATSVVPANFELTNTTDNQTINLTSVEICPVNGSVVYLTTAAPLPDDKNFSLQISNIADAGGNRVAVQSRTFSTLTPKVGEAFILNHREIEVRFTEAVQAASASLASNYSLSGISGTPAVQIVSPEIVRLTYPNPMAQGQNYSLTVRNVADLNGNTMQPSTQNLTFTSYVSQVFPRTSKLLEIVFSEEMPTAAVQDENGYFLNGDTNLKPVSAVRSTQNPAIVTLLFANDFIENQAYTITLGGFGAACRRYVPQSVHEFILDRRPPQATAVRVLAPDRILVVFNKALDRATAEALNHYSVSGGIGRPTQATLRGSEVELRLGNRLQDGISYTLTVQNVQDVLRNTMSTATLTFRRPPQPQRNELIITEILADPTPAVSLPETEFIEIYNASATPFDLLGIKFADESGATALGAGSIVPGEYIILCPANAVEQWQPFGRVIGLNPWRSLTNSGESIRLLDMDDKVIDSLRYSDTWYRDAVKRNGGWTLERVDLQENSCETANNWFASTDERGGTPGTQNSLFGKHPDQTPPRIASFIVTDAQTLQIRMSEPVSRTILSRAANYRLSGEAAPSIQAVTPSDTLNVRLRLSAPLDSARQYLLIINNIADCIGNVAPDTARIGIGRRVRPRDLRISEIMANPNPPAGSLITANRGEYIEITNLTNELIRLNTVQLGYETRLFTLPNRTIAPNELLVLTSTTRAANFGNRGVGITSFPTLADGGAQLTLTDTSGFTIDAVRYSSAWYGDADKQRGGWSLEMIDLTNFCAEEQNWRASVHPSGGTPGTPNSVRGTVQDNTPPRVASAMLRNEREVEVQFSELMAVETLRQINSYTLTQGAQIREVQVISRRQVRLLLAQPLNPALAYRLQISGLRDCAGNLLTPFTQNLGIGRNPQRGELLITEILADETPKVGLPMAEFIEIYNNSDDLISLQNVQLSDDNATLRLPSVFLSPRQYAVLCATSRVDSFRQHRPEPQRVIGVTSFPSLSNTGERLALSVNGLVLHEVNYRSNWYTDATKRNGGWSLEMIDTDNLCSEAENWTASVHPSGGTPGQPNSVLASNPDLTSPELVNVQLASSSLTLTFSERMDSTALATLANYRIEPAIAIRGLELQNNRIVQLALAESPQAGRLYEVVLSENLRDCAGNPLSANSLRTTFGIGRAPVRHELLITEIMFDPSPPVQLPDREYIELYNNTDALISLAGVSFTKPESNFSLRLPPLVIAARGYIVLANTSAATQIAAAVPSARVVGVANFPSLSNTNELLEIRHLGSLIHSVNYQVGWHEAAKRDGGWSLEMIDTDQPCQQASNWISSVDARGGTPGSANSVRRPNPDRTPPQVQEVRVLNERLLRITFNEPMDSASLLPRANYLFTNGLLIDSVQVLNEQTVVLQLFRAVERGALNRLTIREVRDCSGNQMVQATFNFGLGATPQKFELLITELMPDPSPVVGLPESEYVEIFNASDKVLSLNGLRLNNANGTTGVLPDVNILPQSYVIVCPSTSATAFRAFLPEDRVVAPNRWPALSNTSDVMQLRNAQGLLLHQVAYRATWISDVQKRDGGWSLEMRDTNNPCAGNANWEASEHPSGGTPAAPNSIRSTLTDSQPPQIQRVETADGRTVRVVFSEAIDSLAAMQAVYLLNNTLTISTITFRYAQPDEILLTLPQSLARGERATLQIRNLRDCAGNTLFNSPVIPFVVPQEAASGDLIINEILFNPPPNGVDFVEIYNKSDKFINLQNWVIANATTNRIITTEMRIMPPQSYLVLTPDAVRLKQQYSRAIDSLVQVVNLPSYNDRDGSVRLLTPQGLLMDRLDYEERWHFPLLERKEGVSLERISFNAPTQDRNNWFSAAAPFFGTPTFLNSQSERQSSLATLKDCFRIENQVFTPDGNGFQDFMLLHLDCAATGGVATIKIFDAAGRLMKTLLNQQTVAPGMFLSWDGTTDDGTKARIGPYLLMIELFDLDGNIKREQLKVVVGAQ
jgi:hypothetical protein